MIDLAEMIRTIAAGPTGAGRPAPVGSKKPAVVRRGPDARQIIDRLAFAEEAELSQAAAELIASRLHTPHPPYWDILAAVRELEVEGRVVRIRRGEDELDVVEEARS